MTPADAAALLSRDPKRTGIFCDFDGTLSAIVDDPSQAVAIDGAREVLRDLGKRYRRVAVLSGRPVEFLQQQVGVPNVDLVGLYGLEVLRHGRRRDHAQAGAWREVVADVAATAADEGPGGMVVESKGLSLTLHYRQHPELKKRVEGFAANQAARSGLMVRNARMSVELHPPVHADKGTALNELVSDLGAVTFLGDDLGDLPAFDALDALGDAGVDVVRGAIASPEVPETLLARADLVLEGPAEALAFLASLIDRAE